MDGFTFSNTDEFNMEQISFTGGSKETIPLEFYNENGEKINITNYQVIWTMSRFGESEHTLLTKEGVLAGDYACNIVLNSDDTKNLSGKFVHQVTIIDYLGNERVPAKGIIKINRNNNNSNVIQRVS